MNTMSARAQLQALELDPTADFQTTEENVADMGITICAYDESDGNHPWYVAMVRYMIHRDAAGNILNY